MVNICEEFGKEYDVMFNAKKTLGICYGDVNACTNRQMYLYDVDIKWNSDAATIKLTM